MSNIRAGLVLLDPDTFAVLPNGIVPLEYNPDTLTRTFKIKGAEEGGDRSEALRITGPPVETFKFDAELDASDLPDQTRGIAPQLAVLEMLAYPASAALQNHDALAHQGTLEIMPIQSPLPIFVWSALRIVPVRLTDLSVTEEAFDDKLNPWRAKVSLTLRVLSIDDLFFSDRGGSLYMTYQRQKETLAQSVAGGSFGQLGISGLPQ